ncbi:hypothetical protein ACFV2V_13920 [Streptomyces sp. NPDC059698]|uniref:hypothetical protein n=1 Tax=unclassified Streptomyces TaxID=2593676 RepID=UPI00093E953C|nr:hypothetical protein [Streptomyces sp. CB02366]OKJ38276.1 hypothetical protein AMK24_11550 [Streptomyces sp. CB02366]
MTFTPRNWAAGEVVTAALLNQEIRDQLNSMFDAWTPYTPTWSGATTNPAIGNGTVTARHMKWGRSCRVRWDILMGSTTTYGSGGWSLSLPFPAHATGNQSGTMHAFQSGRVDGQIAVSPGASVGLVFFPTSGSPANLSWASSSVPFTWAAGGRLFGYLEYETAS